MPSRAHQNGQGAASREVKPGDYAVSSPQSRAAARALLTARRAAQGEGTLIQVVSVLGCDDPERKCTCPVPEAGTFGLCRCFL